MPGRRLAILCAATVLAGGILLLAALDAGRWPVAALLVAVTGGLAWMGLRQPAPAPNRLRHDFGNLLAIIAGNTEMLLDELSDPQHRAIAAEIDQACRRGRELCQAAAPADASSPQPCPAGPARRVLLVDDEALLRDLISDMLTKAGFEVERTPDAETALARLDAGMDFALMITDQRLPGMSGTDLGHLLAERRPDLPIILISADHPPGDSLPYLAKPFRRDELLAMVEKVLAAQTSSM